MGFFSILRCCFRSSKPPRSAVRGVERARSGDDGSLSGSDASDQGGTGGFLGSSQLEKMEIKPDMVDLMKMFDGFVQMG